MTQETINSFWAWWTLIVVWLGLGFWIGHFIDNRDLMVRTMAFLIIALTVALFFGSVQWLYYMQVWPFIPQ